MTRLSDSLVSSSARRLAIRRRPDLVFTKQRYQGKTYWVVKDPVGLNYFRFQEEEFSILQMLDGDISLDEIKERFEDEFPPQKIGVEEIQNFVGMLHRSGLVLASVPGQGIQLKKRRDDRTKKELWSKLSNILAIRFKGIDPDRLLNWMHPLLKWMYSPWMVAICLLLDLSALTLVLVQFDVFRSKLPEFHQFFSVKNAFWLALALGVTKVIHEFGHGLTCKHFGGECHEMGVMVLVLTPCLYCNVSDSWMLPNKWHRAAIGAGGMYIELVIASICTFVWWFTEPGLINNLCLSTMFVCSVSTLVFNSNPLLRYDGYYILSDVLEIPNLRQKATDILGRKLNYWCLGIEPQEDPFLPQRKQLLFALYSVAAAVYRWLVVFSILFFLYKVFEPYRLEIIGRALAMASIFGLVVQPVWKIYKFFSVPGRLHKVKRIRVAISLALVACAIAAVVLIPLPYHVYCALEIQAEDARNIYVTVGGRLIEVRVKPGDAVKQGELLAQLENLDLQFEVEQLLGERDSYRARLDSLQGQRLDDKNVALLIPQVQELLATADSLLEKKKKDLNRLRLVAPEDGTILPPPEIPNKPSATGELSSWSGTPLDPKNLEAVMKESELFCQIGDPRQMEALLVIDQTDIEFVHAGSTVEIVLDQFPGERIQGVITEISSNDLKVTPQHLSNKAGGELPTETDESGIERPMNTSYQARVPLPDPRAEYRLGIRGLAKVRAGDMTLGERFWRWVVRTFHFKL